MSDSYILVTKNKFFNTGNIVIESAGTSLAEVSLSSLDNTKQIYEYIEKVIIALSGCI